VPLRQNPLPPLHVGRGEEYRERRVKISSRSSRREQEVHGDGKAEGSIRKGGRGGRKSYNHH